MFIGQSHLIKINVKTLSHLLPLSPSRRAKPLFFTKICSVSTTPKTHGAWLKLQAQETCVIKTFLHLSKPSVRKLQRFNLKLSWSMLNANKSATNRPSTCLRWVPRTSCLYGATLRKLHNPVRREISKWSTNCCRPLNQESWDYRASKKSQRKLTLCNYKFKHCRVKLQFSQFKSWGRNQRLWWNSLNRCPSAPFKQKRSRQARRCKSTNLSNSLCRLRMQHCCKIKRW